MNRPKIKICGITSKLQAVEIASLDVNALGFILYKKSPRYISPTQLKEIIASVPAFTKTVGVFVDEPLEDVVGICQLTTLDMVQLSGAETPEYCTELSRKGISWIKASRIKDAIDVEEISLYQSNCILLDAWSDDEFGGTGKKFDWELVTKLKDKFKIVLAGGINSANVQKAIRPVEPYAIDISSGVEYSPGNKSIFKIRQLLDRVGIS